MAGHALGTEAEEIGDFLRRSGERIGGTGLEDSDLAQVLNVEFDADHLLGGIIFGARDSEDTDFGIDQSGGQACSGGGHEDPQGVPPTGEANDDLAGIGVSDRADDAFGFNEPRVFGGGGEQGERGMVRRGKRTVGEDADHGIVQVRREAALDGDGGQVDPVAGDEIGKAGVDVHPNAARGILHEEAKKRSVEERDGGAKMDGIGTGRFGAGQVANLRGLGELGQRLGVESAGERKESEEARAGTETG